MAPQDEEALLEEITTSEYKYGFVTDIESDKAPKGLNEDIIRLISSKKIDGRIVDVGPLGLSHFLPLVEGLEAPFQQPLRLVFL